MSCSLELTSREQQIMSTRILTINKEDGISRYEGLQEGRAFHDFPQLEDEAHEFKNVRAFLDFNFNASLEHSFQDTAEPTDHLGFYIHELDGIKLFSKEDISDLAMQIEDAKNEIKAIKAEIYLTQNEKKTLHKEILDIESKMNQVKQSLVETNLRTVFAIARKHLNRGLSFIELISAGKLGLEKAVESYESSQGLDFYAYTIFWIRLSIARAVVAHRRNIVKTPEHNDNVVVLGKRPQSS